MSNIYMNISTICGNNLYTRDDGHVLYEAIKNILMNNESVLVDFENKEISSESFLDEAIVELYLDTTTIDFSKKIVLKNVVSTDQMLLNRIYEYRKQLQKKEKKKKQ